MWGFGNPLFVSITPNEKGFATGCFPVFPKGSQPVRLFLWSLWLAHPGLYTFSAPAMS